MVKLVKIIEKIILSAVPILEQKAAIPYAMSNMVAFVEGSVSLSDLEAYFYTLIGALLPAPLILLFIPVVFKFLKRFDKIGRLVSWYENRAMRKGKNIVKYEMLGLFIFVAITLPGTGVWTGSTVAAMLGLPFKKSMITVILGAAVCGLILLFVFKGAIHLFWIH